MAADDRKLLGPLGVAIAYVDARDKKSEDSDVDYVEKLALELKEHRVLTLKKFRGRRMETASRLLQIIGAGVHLDWE
jgi:hypothetical protein